MSHIETIDTGTSKTTARGTSDTSSSCTSMISQRVRTAVERRFGPEKTDDADYKIEVLAVEALSRVGGLGFHSLVNLLDHETA